MKNTYDFYFDKNIFTCRYDNNKRIRILKDSDALMMLQRINRYKFSSFKVKENMNNNKRKLYLYMNGSNNRVFIHNFKKFDEFDLFDELPNHLKDIESACDKFTKKRFRPKEVTIKKFVATATALALITGGLSFSLNKDKSLDNTNIGYTIEQEYTEYENSNDIETVSTEKTVEKEVNYTFDNKTNSETYKYVYDNYNDVIEKVSEERGISKELLMGMVTQESAGLDSNLMQITYSVWSDHVFTTHNFSTGEDEKIVISNNPSGYKNSVKVISLDSMNDPYNNITIGSLIFRDALETYDYNIPLAIQAYNFGYGNMAKVLNAYSEETGKSKNSIIADSDNVDFTKYTGVVIGQGDCEYLDHVMRYVDSDHIAIKKYDNNNVITIDFNTNNQVKDKTK